MKVTQINNSAAGNQRFTIRHSDGVKTMTATCHVNQKNNSSVWQFQHQNGMLKNFNMFDDGIEFYTKKGW